MNYYKNKVSWCLICDQGWVEIIKNKTTKELFVWCSECESSWKHPEDSKKRELAGSLFDTDIQIEKPKDQDISLEGWSGYILKS